MNFSLPLIIRTYYEYLSYRNYLLNIGGRSPNFPEVLSENIIAFVFKDLVLKKGKGKGDLVHIDNSNIRIEVKTSASNGPSSVSPTCAGVSYLMYLKIHLKAGSDNLNPQFQLFAERMLEVQKEKVNFRETVADKQLLGQRPRLDFNKIFRYKKPLLYGYLQEIVQNSLSLDDIEENSKEKPSIFQTTLFKFMDK